MTIETENGLSEMMHGGVMIETVFTRKAFRTRRALMEVFDWFRSAMSVVAVVVLLLLLLLGEIVN